MDRLAQTAQQCDSHNERIPYPVLEFSYQAALPLYYVERPEITHHTASGTITTPKRRVPLIAIDQLPEWIEVVGAPRELTREQVAAMSCLGVIPKGRSFEVYIAPTCPQKTSIPNRNMNQKTHQFNGHKGDVAAAETTASNQMKDVTIGVSAIGTAGDSASPPPHIGLHQRPPFPTAQVTPPDNPYPVMNNRTRLYGRSNAVQRRQGSSDEHPAERLLRASCMLSYGPSKTAMETQPLSPSSSASTTTTTTVEKSPSIHTSQNGPNIHNNKGVKTTTDDGDTETKTSNPSSPADASNICPDPMAYCRNWCHRGKCRFNEACRYRHEMPRTAKELREVGLERYPSWWVTQTRHGSSKHVRNHAKPQAGPQGNACRSNNNVTGMKDVSSLHDMRPAAHSENMANPKTRTQQQQQTQHSTNAIKPHVRSHGGSFNFSGGGKKKKHNNNSNNNNDNNKQRRGRKGNNNDNRRTTPTPSHHNTGSSSCCSCGESTRGGDMTGLARGTTAADEKRDEEVEVEKLVDI